MVLPAPTVGTLGRRDRPRRRGVLETSRKKTGTFLAPPVSRDSPLNGAFPVGTPMPDGATPSLRRGGLPPS